MTKSAYDGFKHGDQVIHYAEHIEPLIQKIEDIGRKNEEKPNQLQFFRRCRKCDDGSPFVEKKCRDPDNRWYGCEAKQNSDGAWNITWTVGKNEGKTRKNVPAGDVHDNPKISITVADHQNGNPKTCRSCGKTSYYKNRWWDDFAICGCGELLIKGPGCNHITCPNEDCNLQWCFWCGEKYVPVRVPNGRQCKNCISRRLRPFRSSDSSSSGIAYHGTNHPRDRHRIDHRVLRQHGGRFPMRPRQHPRYPHQHQTMRPSPRYHPVRGPLNPRHEALRRAHRRPQWSPDFSRDFRMGGTRRHHPHHQHRHGRPGGRHRRGDAQRRFMFHPEIPYD